MKILHLGKYYYPFTGGIETVTQDICEGSQSNGNDITVYCANESNEYKYSEINNVKVEYFPTLFKFASIPFCFGKFIKLIRTYKQFDLIHVHSPNPLAELFCILLPRNVKLVTTHHADPKKNKIFLALYNFIYRKFLKKCDKISVATENHITYSPSVKSYEEKCRIIPFSIDENRFNKSEKVNTQIEKIQNEYGRYALFVGRHVPYKGLGYLLEAAKSISENILVIGVGPETDKLKSIAPENVKFLGKVMDDDMFSAFYHACEFIVLPSTTSQENFGMVQLEGMCCKKPILTTNLESGVPVVGDDESRILVEPCNVDELARAMTNLFESPEKCIRMGESGRKRFEKLYTRKRFNELHQKMYNEIRP